MVKQSDARRQRALQLEQSGQFDAGWYAARYPDVAGTGMSAAAHYLSVGARLGRIPAADFDAGFYLSHNPDVAAQGIDPFVHFALSGAAEGRGRNRVEQIRLDGLTAVSQLRDTLHEHGQTEPALAGLNDLAGSEAPLVAARAQTELALWAMRDDDTKGHMRALEQIAAAQEGETENWRQQALTTAELLCLERLGRPGAGHAAFARAAQRGRAGPDATLALANFAPTPERRLEAVNRVLAQFSLLPLQLEQGEAPPLDRLSGLPPIPTRHDAQAPLVSVLIAAHNAAATLPATLVSLIEQTWPNLEILVIDDASTDGTAAIITAMAAANPRVRGLHLPVNAGAYGARNHGLAAARGSFVTLLDADDWAHPQRIERQIQHLIDHPGVIGCMGQQARAQADLYFRRWTGQAQLIAPDFSSLMLRRAPFQERFGGWDTVRVSADHELIRRIRSVEGIETIADLKTGPLAFQRDRVGSAVADPVLGITGFAYGARRDYREAQTFFHRHALPEALRYDPQAGTRPFPAPRLMWQDRQSAHGPELSLVVAGDFRRPDGPCHAAAAHISAAQAAGISAGVVEMPLFDPHLAGIGMHPLLRARLGNATDVLSYGEIRSCDLLLLSEPDLLRHLSRYAPEIRPARIKVLLPETAMPGTAPQKTAMLWMQRLTGIFGDVPVEWHPTGAAARAVWQGRSNLPLSLFDWAPPLSPEPLPALEENGPAPAPLRIAILCPPGVKPPQADLPGTQLIAISPLCHDWAVPLAQRHLHPMRTETLPAGLHGLIVHPRTSGHIAHDPEVLAAISAGLPVAIIGKPDTSAGFGSSVLVASDIQTGSARIAELWNDRSELNLHRHAARASLASRLDLAHRLTSSRHTRTTSVTFRFGKILLPRDIR